MQVISLALIPLGIHTSQLAAYHLLLNTPQLAVESFIRIIIISLVLYTITGLQAQAGTDKAALAIATVKEFYNKINEKDCEGQLNFDRDTPSIVVIKSIVSI
ncbi:MAG: hypothetical protein MZV65_15340 [Chromatiales bacterium]|nr:hypothetical protein [Chromatiales bacterium]